MGYTSYSLDNRSIRAIADGYYTKSKSAIFAQTNKREVHPGMNPKNVKTRECKDSEAHPKTVPIQLYLDVTGSMGMIPHELIKVGLPTLMSKLIQAGVSDAALMFGAIGDHECDDVPLQVAQFESGDAELDMWLTRIYLEGGGGLNSGESYILAWYFAANHVQTDAFEKRGKKGFVFTVGDEPYLRSIPKNALLEIMGETCAAEESMSAEKLLEMTTKTNHVYHIHIQHASYRDCPSNWKQLLGDHCIVIKDPKDLAKTICEIILSKMDENDLKTDEHVVHEISTSSDNIDREDKLRL